jgi:hypothetical protein
MRRRARLTTAVAGLVLALTASLSGCMTVHGEEAIVPAATRSEARTALNEWLRTFNEAYRDYDPALSGEVQTGTQGEIDRAGLTAAQGLNPAGNAGYEPIEFSETAFHIPQQAGWPKFFLADATDTQSGSHWLMVFTRNSIDERWLVSYRAMLPAAEVPEFRKDKDGYLEDIPADEGNAGLAVAPAELSRLYALYLQSQGQEGSFAPGAGTTDIVAERNDQNTLDPNWQKEWQDSAVEEERFSPVAVRTEDGGALVFFTERFYEKQTWREGVEPPADLGENPPYTVELLEEDSDVSTAVTREFLSVLTAAVPQGDGEIDLLYRSSGGLIRARGE